jgi:hypothetical protein
VRAARAGSGRATRTGRASPAARALQNRLIIGPWPHTNPPVWCSRGRRVCALRWFFPLPAVGLVASGVAFGRAVTNTQNNAHLAVLAHLVTFCNQRSYRDFLLLPRASSAGEFLCVSDATEFGVPEPACGSLPQAWWPSRGGVFIGTNGGWGTMSHEDPPPTA